MKHLPTSLCLSLFLCTFTPNAQAHDIDFDEYNDACEDDSKLPKGLSYVEYTPDCQYTEGLTVITNGKRFGFANKHGKIIITPTFEEAHGFDDGLALIKQQGKYGYINPTGQIEILPTFDDAWGFWEGYAKISQNSKYGFIDKTGNIVISPTYDETGNWFSEGLVFVKVGDKYGFMDKTGKIVIAPTYDYADDFSEGLAVVGNKTNQTDKYKQPKYRYGYIDKSGKIALAANYDFASTFTQGVAAVTKGDELYFINHQGEIVDTQHLP